MFSIQNNFSWSWYCKLERHGWMFGFVIISLLFCLAFPLLWGECFLWKSVNCFQFISKGCIHQTMTLNKWFAGKLFGYHNDVEFSSTAVWFVNYFLKCNNNKKELLVYTYIQILPLNLCLDCVSSERQKYIFSLFYWFIYSFETLNLHFLLINSSSLCDVRSLFICWFKFICSTCQLSIIKINKKCHKMNATVCRYQ